MTNSVRLETNPAPPSITHIVDDKSDRQPIFISRSVSQISLELNDSVQLSSYQLKVKKLCELAEKRAFKMLFKDNDLLV